MARWRTTAAYRGSALLLALLSALVVAARGGSTPAPSCQQPVGFATEQSPLEASVTCPNLIVSRPRARVASDGRNLIVDAIVRNLGNADSGATTLRVSSRGWPDHFHDVPALAPQGAYRLRLVFPIPASARGRASVFAVKVDPDGVVPELDEDDNTLLTKVFVPAVPDLVVSSVQPAISSDTTTLVLNVVVANIGPVDAAPTSLEARVQGFPTQAVDVPALAAGATRALQLTFDIPDGVRGRGVAMRLRVDPKDVVVESSEDNNARSSKVSIPATFPDLAVTSIDGRYDAASDQVVILASIANQGNRISRATTARLDVGPEWKPTPQALGPIAPGAAASARFVLSVPSQARGGTQTFTLVVDPDGAIAESNEQNNKATTDVAIPPAKPDLTVSNVTAAQRGNRVELKVSVSNSGGPAPASVVEATAPGFAAARVDVAPLGAGGTTTVALALTIPPGTSGSVTITATVDPDRVVDEQLEDNNSSQTKLVIAPPPPPPPKLPDLTVSIARLVPSAGRVDAELLATNRGPGPSAKTTIELSARELGSFTLDVPGLPAGKRTTLQTRIPVPARAAGKRVELTARIDPQNAIAETDERNNDATQPVRLTRLTRPSQQPDLTVAFVRNDEEGDTIELRVRVTSTNASAAATRVDVSAPGFAGAELDVAPLAKDESRVLTLRLRIPPEQHGHSARFTAMVDPANVVAEQSEDNNRAERDITIPSARPRPKPDLTVTIASETRQGDRLDLAIDVTATAARAPATAVRVSAPGLGSETSAVPSLAPGEIVTVQLALSLPKPRREQDVTLTAIVDPANTVAEQREDNNSSVLSVHIGNPRPIDFLGHRVWPTWVAALIALSALVLIAVFVFGPGRSIVRRRRRWSHDSDERHPPDECQHCTHYTRRTKLKVKPAKRTIAHLELARHDENGGEASRKVEEQLVKELNRAVRRYRRREPSDELRDALTPIATGLVEEIEEWLAEETEPGDVEIEAHLEGGKVECTFTRYHCVHGKWEEEDEWELELEDEADEHVAELPVPVAARAAAVALLMTALTAFVAKVDVPEPERPPEARPIAHG